MLFVRRAFPDRRVRRSLARRELKAGSTPKINDQAKGAILPFGLWAIGKPDLTVGLSEKTLSNPTKPTAGETDSDDKSESGDRVSLLIQRAGALRKRFAHAKLHFARLP